MKAQVLAGLLSAMSIGAAYRDIPLPKNVTPAPRTQTTNVAKFRALAQIQPQGITDQIASVHIRDGGSFGALVVNDFTWPCLLFYDYNTYDISVVELTNVNWSQINYGPDLDIVGTNVIIAGTSVYNGSPGMSGLTICEYGITTNTLPTQVSYGPVVTNGDTSTRDVAVSALGNGGVAVAGIQNQYGYAAYVAYRRPDGSWTNYGKINLASSIYGLPPTFITAAEQKSDGSWWVFDTKDGGDQIVANKFSPSATDLILTNAFELVNGRFDNGIRTWGSQAPYDEICTVNAISDVTSNRILLEYNNDDYVGLAEVRITHLVLVGLEPNTNHYLLTISSNSVYRLNNNFGVHQMNKSVSMSYFNQDTNGQPAAPYYGPLRVQSLTNEISQASYQVLTNAQWSPLPFHAHRPEVIARLGDGTWHLISFDPFAATFPPSNLRITGIIK